MIPFHGWKLLTFLGPLIFNHLQFSIFWLSFFGKDLLVEFSQQRVERTRPRPITGGPFQAHEPGLAQTPRYWRSGASSLQRCLGRVMEWWGGWEWAKNDVFTLPPIIMEMESGVLEDVGLVSKQAIFHFHDYGRKGKTFETMSGAHHGS